MGEINLPSSQATLPRVAPLSFKRESLLVFISFSLLREGGPLAVEEIAYLFNLLSRFAPAPLTLKRSSFFVFNLPPGFVGLTALLGGDKPPVVASNAPSRCPS